MHRTKNFLHTLLLQARVAQLRIVRRPHCQVCNALMEIVRGPGLKERYWRCDRLSHHPSGDPFSYRWDIGLSQKAREYVNQFRAERERHLARLRAQGKPLHTAMLRRRPWRARQEQSV